MEHPKVNWEEEEEREKADDDKYDDDDDFFRCVHLVGSSVERENEGKIRLC